MEQIITNKILDDDIGVKIQDQTTPPLASYFVQSVSNFTISADTGISTVDSLVYTFEATAVHGITAGKELLLLCTTSGASFNCIATGVSTNTITVDRPIDHDFKSACTLGRITTSQMAVNGSVTPQVFSIRSGVTPTDITSCIITMLDDTAMSDDKFAGISALTNGLVLRIVNSYQSTIFCFKSNQEIRQFCYDLEYADKAPATKYGLTAHVDIKDKYGVVLRIAENDVVQWVVQDDLAGLDSLKITAQGQETEGEV